MKTREQMWREAVAFHGHSCPGLAIGVRIGLDFLEDAGLTGRAEDEEIVAVAETDACGVDGLQVILGCTAGKGNLWLDKRGKHVFTLFHRDPKVPGRRYSWLAYPAEEMSRPERTEFFLTGPREILYAVGPASRKLPPPAAVYPSVDCAVCGERTAEPQLRVREGRLVCLDCAGQAMIFSDRIIL